MNKTLEYIINAAKDPEKFIAECTAEYLNRIKLVAKNIADNDSIKIVAIAGPSASGKTTTAHILMNELEALGEKTAVLSLDDFYKEAGSLPRLSDGSRDLESVNSLDTVLLKKHFGEIIKTGKTLLPQYDFKTNTRTSIKKAIDVGNRGIVIAEGLHALNPIISDLVPRENIYKIYISVNCSVEDENGIQILTSRQIRLIRRILRDERFRGSDVRETLALWNNVLVGENKYLFPYKDTSDFKITTMQPFEICVYKEPFCSLRSAVDRNTPWYEFFLNTINALEEFPSIDVKFVPENSLIKEFIN